MIALVKKFLIALFWDSVLCVWILASSIAAFLPRSRWIDSIAARLQDKTQFLRFAIFAGRWDLVWKMAYLRVQLAALRIRSWKSDGSQRH